MKKTHFKRSNKIIAALLFVMCTAFVGQHIFQTMAATPTGPYYRFDTNYDRSQVGSNIYTFVSEISIGNPQAGRTYTVSMSNSLRPVTAGSATFRSGQSVSVSLSQTKSTERFSISVHIPSGCYSVSGTFTSSIPNHQGVAASSHGWAGGDLGPACQGSGGQAGAGSTAPAPSPSPAPRPTPGPNSGSGSGPNSGSGNATSIPASGAGQTSAQTPAPVANATNSQSAPSKPNPSQAPAAIAQKRTPDSGQVVTISPKGIQTPKQDTAPSPFFDGRLYDPVVVSEIRSGKFNISNFTHWTYVLGAFMLSMVVMLLSFVVYYRLKFQYPQSGQYIQK